MDWRTLAVRRANELDEAQRKLDEKCRQIRVLETAAAEASVHKEQAGSNVATQSAEPVQETESIRAELENKSKRQIESMRAKLNQHLKEEKAKTTKLEAEHETTVAKVKAEQIAELKAERDATESLRVENEALQNQKFCHESELEDANRRIKEADEVQRSLEEALRLAGEANISRASTNLQGDGKDGRAAKLLADLEDCKKLLEQGKRDLSQSENRHAALKLGSGTREAKMQEELEKANAKHESNEMLLRLRAEDIKRLKQEGTKLKKNNIALDQKLRWSNEESKKLRKEVEQSKTQGDQSASNPFSSVSMNGEDPSQKIKREPATQCPSGPYPKRSKTHDQRPIGPEDDIERAENEGKVDVGDERNAGTIKVATSQGKV